MPYTLQDIEPFDYVKTKDNKRGFLIVNIYDGKDWDNTIEMIEFGKPRNRPVRIDIEKFLNMLNSTQLMKFIPKI